jgi:hypothetical protein
MTWNLTIALDLQGIIPAIKGAWIVYAATWESKSRSDAKRLSYISSKAVWEAVKRSVQFISALIAHVEAQILGNPHG